MNDFELMVFTILRKLFGKVIAYFIFEVYLTIVLFVKYLLLFVSLPFVFIYLLIKNQKEKTRLTNRNLC